MPRKTQASRADELGVGINVIRQAKRAGVNIWNDPAMRKWMDGLKPKRKRAAKKAAPKMTQTALAESVGVTRHVIQNARNSGVDIWNPAELQTWLDGRRARVNPTAKVAVPAAEDLPGVTIEDLELEVKGAETYDDVKILKEKISALLQAQKVRKEERDLIPLKEAKEAVIKIVSGLKGRLLKVPSDTAPRVEGLNAAKAEKVIRGEMLKALDDLATEGNGIFEGS